ncbi:hypothetical protein KCH_00850 [Kitasatospora cheerisanensis KCTC 2395]|uniref:Uncharacterized protein n=1 Tax=Kitasatospora cheerisanensis KCTC 2395 TaxID=1348663 RepID=A0A066Z311_9ACTN|nr:hypothetical protein KCH_00850 [Kitasatospora cheerisanensis KCTC 2395]
MGVGGLGGAAVAAIPAAASARAAAPVSAVSRARTAVGVVPMGGGLSPPAVRATVGTVRPRYLGGEKADGGGGRRRMPRPQLRGYRIPGCPRPEAKQSR